MYRIPSDKSISKCVIDKDTVEENLKQKLWDKVYLKNTVAIKKMI